MPAIVPCLRSDDDENSRRRKRVNYRTLYWPAALSKLWILLNKCDNCCATSSASDNLWIASISHGVWSLKVYKTNDQEIQAMSLIKSSPSPLFASFCFLCVPLRLRNDLYYVGWGVKLYSLTHSLTHTLCACLDKTVKLILQTNEPTNQSINQVLFIVRPKVDQRADQLYLPHTRITKTQK